MRRKRYYAILRAYRRNVKIENQDSKNFENLLDIGQIRPIMDCRLIHRRIGCVALWIHCIDLMTTRDGCVAKSCHKEKPVLMVLLRVCEMECQFCPNESRFAWRMARYLLQDYYPRFPPFWFAFRPIQAIVDCGGNDQQRKRGKKEKNRLTLSKIKL